MRERWPAIHPPDDFIGLYDPLGGYSEPDEYIPALANRCRHLGVEVLEWTCIDTILTTSGRIRGVQTASGLIEADAVVCTSYSWTNKLMETIEMQLPVKAFVHQRYVTRPLREAVNIAAINANPLFGYVRPAAGKRLLLGIETADRQEWKVDSFDFHMKKLSADPQLRATLMDTFALVLPALADTQWESERLGLLTFSIDNEPILGPIRALPGLFVGVAFHSGGFAYNPVSGMLLAQFVTNGQTRIDVSAFSPDRFDRDETARYLETTVKQKDAGSRRH
jgi:sarcosine oxidase subunit beta